MKITNAVVEPLIAFNLSLKKEKKNIEGESTPPGVTYLLLQNKIVDPSLRTNILTYFCQNIGCGHMMDLRIF